MTLLAPSLGAQEFRAGDLYLMNGGLGTVFRIDPVSGETTPFLQLASPNGNNLSYDPFRDRLILRGQLPLMPSPEMLAVDAQGQAESLGDFFPEPTMAAPTGDGRIYLQTPNWAWRYLDADGDLHTLFEADGVTPFYLDGGTAFLLPGGSDLIYDPVSNALVLPYKQATTGDCGTLGHACIRFIQLSADGTRVLDDSSFVEFDFGGEDSPENLSRGPHGSILVTNVLPPNANPQSRLLQLETDGGVALSTFSQTSVKPDAGAYSHLTGKAVILDTVDDLLRRYYPSDPNPLGESVLAPGVSPQGSSGEAAKMTQICGVAPSAVLSIDTDTISASAGGTQALRIDASSAFSGDLYVVLGSASGWSPGLNFGAGVLPLNLDAYTILTAKQANQGPFWQTFGVLDSEGAADASISLPAGSSPSLVNLELYHAAVVLDAGLGPTRATNAAPLRIAP